VEECFNYETHTLTPAEDQPKIVRELVRGNRFQVEEGLQPRGHKGAKSNPVTKES